VERATASGFALPPVPRAGKIVSACSPSVALRFTLGYMLSPASQARVGQLFINTRLNSPAARRHTQLSSSSPPEFLCVAETFSP
jgi:hypothetical protein